MEQTRDTEDKTTASLYWRGVQRWSCSPSADSSSFPARMDLNRVKYLLRSYLRVRLAKIEEHALHYLSAEANVERLSPQELVFAQG